MEKNKDLNIIKTKLKEGKIEIIKRYPFNGKTKYLIDKFYIIGYRPNQFKKIIINNSQNKKNLEKIAKKIKIEDLQNSNINKRKSTSKLFIEELPTILNEITNDYKKKVPDIDVINSMLFPNKSIIFFQGNYVKRHSQSRMTTYTHENLNYAKNNNMNMDEDENFTKNEKFGRETIINTTSANEADNDDDNLKIMKNTQYNMVFSYNPQEGKNSKKSINGFAYTFYKKYKEKITIKDVNFTFYIPMTFCIISEYPYYRSYYKLCNQIIQLFQSKK
jgi:hypothetical protein